MMVDLVPVDHDPFADDGGSSAVPVDHDPFAGPGYLADIGRTIPSALTRGGATLIGLPGAISHGVGAGLDWVEQKIRGETDAEFSARASRRTEKLGFDPRKPALLPTPERVVGAIEGVTGDLYKPQTIPGQYAGTVAEFAPAAMAGPGGALSKLLAYAVGPGIASEAAGQLTAGTSAEPWARGGAALGAGVLGAALSRPASTSRVLQGQLEGISEQHITQASALINDAARQGMRLTWPEALSKVAGRPVLTDIQRIAESAPQSRATMQNIMGARPAQVEAAARNQFDVMAPATANPSTVGPAASWAAEDSIQAGRDHLNRQTRPLYDAARSERIDPQIFAQVRADPVFQEGLRRVRNDPFIGPTLRGYPDDSVAIIDAIKKNLNEASRNLRDPLAGTARNNYAASIIGQGRDRMVRAADVATGSDPARGIVGSYELARTVQRGVREQVLQPLLAGPLGRIAERPDTRRAIEALFPDNPLPNSANEVATAVGAIGRRNEWAARQLVRGHLEMRFNEAVQNLQSGPNQWGGAKFAAVIAGNPQQRENLRAAIEALPNGRGTWGGFSKFLDVMEAMAARQSPGSKTAFNTAELQGLTSGGVASGAVKLGLSPSKWLSFVSDKWGQWQLGKNLGELAQIMTDPRAGPMLKRIAEMPGGSREAQITALRLAALLNQARQGGSGNK